jgi:hypothetical protein
MSEARCLSPAVRVRVCFLSTSSANVMIALACSVTEQGVNPASTTVMSNICHTLIHPVDCFSALFDNALIEPVGYIAPHSRSSVDAMSTREKNL